MVSTVVRRMRTGSTERALHGTNVHSPCPAGKLVFLIARVSSLTNNIILVPSWVNKTNLAGARQGVVNNTKINEIGGWCVSLVKYD